MGRKRWWKGGLELLVLCFVHRVIHADGEVGCLFSKNVCRSGVETCYDDSAFGRCVQSFGNVDEDDVYRYDLDSTELELLRRQLERLAVGGYEWTHPYTQCVMQGSLYSLRYRMKHELEFCQELADLDELRAIDDYGEEDQVDDRDPEPLAVVNFTPTRGHGYGDFADEKYYPPVSPKKPKYNGRHKFSDDNNDDYTYAYSSYLKKPERQRIAKLNNFVDDEIITNVNKNNLPINSQDLSSVDTNPNEGSKNFRELAQRLNIKYEQPIYRSRRQPNRDVNFLRSLKSSSMDNYADAARDILRDGNRETAKSANDRRWQNSQLDKDIWNFIKMNDSLPKRDDENLGEIEFLRNESDDDDDSDDSEWLNRNTGDEEEDVDEENDDDDQEYVSPIRETMGFQKNRQRGGIYTEGGLVEPLELHNVIRQGPDDIIFDEDLNALLWNRDLGAFQRPERLDVKKPGPLFSTNNYAFKTQSPSSSVIIDENDENDLASQQDSKQVKGTPVVKKDMTNVIYNGKTYENVDMDHMYIQFNNEFTKWSDGERVVEEVAKLLGISPDVFTDVRVGRAEVTFKVNNGPNSDAMLIVPKIDHIREELQKTTGMEVLRAGIGDRVKLPPSLDVKAVPKPMSPGLFGAIVAAGGAAAAAAAVVTLIIARKHAKSRAKLAGLTTVDPEASKDYQDLCRARMHAKQPENKPESPRIISLSRESESNRSSTSSWGEEAAALTNMDIATGHMVLTYMEDHLQNKDRLDQEWAAICAYEAEPSSLAIATEKSNIERNRPGSALPYDHSRIVLNDLSNANNSDYINASTITDHDPRNPAYIATQGPLPQTSADFWQLVWEQGSVVIVMLTRLTEEGRAMCHRYWPEEGSELYHIYEVHLVSEHIWCDDYLVRSFYLKNLRTGETRTVTQFHFLSWPENGVPQSTKALLEFRRKVNKSYRGRSCPIVVHCSDGAGRTGTYCLIDMVLNRMAKGAKEIDIAAALEHIRDQRPGMVATKQQFEFVLVAVAEEVHAILKALPVQLLEKEKSATTTSPPQSTSGSDQ